MKLTLEYFRNRKIQRLSQKQNSRELEYKLLIELREKLDELLENNDSVMIEVDPKVLSEFNNILEDKLLSIYHYEYVNDDNPDSLRNKFIFRVKELYL